MGATGLRLAGQLPLGGGLALGLSGGVAILIPCTFQLLREVVVTPGKIVAAQVQTRTDRFWLVSVYCHPNSAKSDCERLAGWLVERGMAC